MANSPIVTVEQGLEIDEWLKKREKKIRGYIRMLEHNLRHSKEANLRWQAKYWDLKADNLMLRHQPHSIKCRKRLIPMVKWLLDF